jgi:hypothetical protein
VKPAHLVLAELDRRGLRDRSEKIAAAYRVPLADVVTTTHRPEVVAARHAIWIWQIDELGSQSAVARMWGVDRTSVMYAEQNDGREIVRVLLDEVRGRRFEWQAGPGDPFAILIDGVRVFEFATYETARAWWGAWLERCDLALPRNRRELDESPRAPPHPPPSAEVADGVGP